MAENIVVLFQSEDGRRLVRQKCKAAGLDMAVLEQLIHAELDHSGSLTRRGMNADFDDIFGVADEGAADDEEEE